jgi:hypothetical protein
MGKAPQLDIICTVRNTVFRNTDSDLLCDIEVAVQCLVKVVFNKHSQTSGVSGIVTSPLPPSLALPAQSQIHLE